MALRHTSRCLWAVQRAIRPALQSIKTVSSSPLLAKPQVTLIRPQAATFGTTQRQQVSFNVQDQDDFGTRVLKSDIPVIVDFHAAWCGPCKLLGPRLESLIASKEGKVALAKVDIDDLQDLAMDHGVEAVPTVIAVKNGRIVDKFVGLKDDDQLDSFVEKLL